MRVNEIFYSIDGEGIRTGELAVFIRLAGCNLRCSYCDTEYALSKKDGTEMCVVEILNEVNQYGCKNVTITGGEPLIHKGIEELVDLLTEYGYEVNIETNGSVDIRPFLDRNVIITMDYKTPSSGEEEKMLIGNIERLRENDVLKFVVGTEEDLEATREIICMADIKAYKYISPVFGQINPKDIVEYMKKYKFEKTRCQLQLHKIIWNPNERGV